MLGSKPVLVFNEMHSLGQERSFPPPHWYDLKTAPIGHPYTTNEKGQGPAWGNSLFEDNAEFGFGIAVANAQKRAKLRGAIQEAVAQKAADEGLEWGCATLLMMSIASCVKIIGTSLPPCPTTLFDNHLIVDDACFSNFQVLHQKPGLVIATPLNDNTGGGLPGG